MKKKKEERQAILLRTTSTFHEMLAEEAKQKGISLNELLTRRLVERINYLKIPVIEMTDEEFKVVVEELAERVKDFVYSNSKVKVRLALSEMRGRIRPDTNIEFVYKVRVFGNDIVQILSRLRRGKIRKKR